jgi:CheY-like chemotaxis protein
VGDDAAFAKTRTTCPRKSLRADLIFLDVQMPELNGFEVIEEVGAELVPAVIFVNAYDQFALRASEVHAFDYLLKPPAATADPRQKTSRPAPDTVHHMVNCSRDPRPLRSADAWTEGAVACGARGVLSVYINLLGRRVGSGVGALVSLSDANMRNRMFHGLTSKVLSVSLLCAVAGERKPWREARRHLPRPAGAG